MFTLYYTYTGENDVDGQRGEGNTSNPRPIVGSTTAVVASSLLVWHEGIKLKRSQQ